MIYIGIDNGVSGSIGAIDENGTVMYFGPTPVKECLNYTKKVAHINRLDRPILKEILDKLCSHTPSRIGLERPMVNPKRFTATVSAVRLLEAVEGVLEDLHLPVTAYIDSKAWQKMLLPEGIKGSADLKKASMEIGIRMWPVFSDAISRQKDADGLMIAEYMRRTKV